VVSEGNPGRAFEAGHLQTNPDGSLDASLGGEVHFDN
jgi:hypothetical protein